MLLGTGTQEHSMTDMNSMTLRGNELATLLEKETL
jgi:hypothetical protein